LHARFNHPYLLHVVANDSSFVTMDVAAQGSGGITTATNNNINKQVDDVKLLPFVLRFSSRQTMHA
jgi:hypothetical protein